MMFSKGVILMISLCVTLSSCVVMSCEKNENRNFTCTCTLDSTGEELEKSFYDLNQKGAESSCSNLEKAKETELGEGVSCVLEEVK